MVDQLKPPPVPRPDEQAIVDAMIRAVVSPPSARFDRRGTIGRGGVGTVDVQLDRVLQRRTAIKTLIATVHEQPVLARAFLREAQITAQLDHPHLVPVHDIGVDSEDHFYFTMKLVEGDTLAQRIERYHYEARSGEPEVLFEQLVGLIEVLVKVCNAVAFAHSRGVLHCDLKPQNILVGDFGQVYLMDWGFAQLLPPPADPARARRWVKDPLPPLPTSATDGLVFGTPGYMAPEQALAQPLDERADVFSLGALLYQILSGSPPFAAATPQATLRLAQNHTVTPLTPTHDGPPGLRPRGLIQIAERAMAKAPSDRFASAVALEAELSRYLRGGGPFPTVTVPPGTHLMREGEPADRAFIIATGQCEVYKTVNGNKVLLQVLGPGEAVGEMALLAEGPRSASVMTLSRTTLYVITREVLEQELHSMKPWMGALVRSLAGRFRAAQDRIVSSGVTRGVPALDEDDVELWSEFK